MTLGLSPEESTRLPLRRDYAYHVHSPHVCCLLMESRGIVVQSRWKRVTHVDEVAQMSSILFKVIEQVGF